MIQDYYAKLESDKKKEDEAKEWRDRAKALETTMQCNCDLDNWEPDRRTNHSWVCRIHKKALSDFRQARGLGT